MTLLDMQSKILQKLRQQNNKQITQILYRLPIAVGKDLIHYNSVEISGDEDVSMMFDYRAQFPKIHIMELFVDVGESILSSTGSTPDLASAALSLLERSLTFAMVSPVENKNIQTEKCK